MQRVDSLNSHDIPLDTITTMDAVVDYLDWWGTANERMTAHYLLGSVYRDQDNAPMCQECATTSEMAKYCQSRGQFFD